jgi:hypothetical protein
LSDHIAHLGICDDTFRLALLHPQIEPLFKKLMAEQRDIAHMGAITRTADKWSVELVVWAREQAHNGALDAIGEQKLAFVLGALTHRSADRLTKPITNCWRGNADKGNSEANESKIVQDIFVWKEVYGSGAGSNEGEWASPFSPAVLRVPQGEAEAKSEEYFRVLLRRALISMHTIAPDGDHIHEWLTAFLQGLQTFPKSIAQYAELASRWDAATVKKYLIDKNFYCREDELVLLARSIQRGSTVKPEQVVRACAEISTSHSRYARALAKAIDYLVAASELFRGEIEADEASRRFDIGVPELSLQE